MKNKTHHSLTASALMWLKGRKVEDLTLQELRSLGPYSQKLLAEIDITGWLDLKKRGWKQCYFEIVQKNPKNANANLAYGIAAAESCADWRELTGAEKKEILDFHNETKKRFSQISVPKKEHFP